MGEIDMDGPRDEEGRILDPEFYPVIIIFRFSFLSHNTVHRPSLTVQKLILFLFLFLFCFLFLFFFNMNTF